MRSALIRMRGIFVPMDDGRGKGGVGGSLVNFFRSVRKVDSVVSLCCPCIWTSGKALLGARRAPNCTAAVERTWFGNLAHPRVAIARDLAVRSAGGGRVGCREPHSWLLPKTRFGAQVVAVARSGLVAQARFARSGGAGQGWGDGFEGRISRRSPPWRVRGTARGLR